MLRIVLIFMLGACLGIVLYPAVQNWQRSPESPPLPEIAAEAAVPAGLPLRAGEEEIAASRRNAIVRAVEKVAPSVVSVNTIYLKEYEVQYRHPFWDFFYYPDIIREKTPGIGSGFVIREDGYILTNSHVVENAREIAVTFSDGRRFDLKDIRRDVLIDRQMDLAVLRIDADDLIAVEFGRPNDVITGEWAIAIGNPFGLTIEDPSPTVTVGVISAVDRDFHPEDGRAYQDMIQTDASINPGNSGGPLVNSDGKVIGVNTFIFSKSGGSLGIGFAIPIDRAEKVARDLIENGHSRAFWTGITIYNLNRQIARMLGLATDSGALIARVEAKSPAERAGLNPGDVIVMVNGHRVRSADDAIEAFREGRVGDIFVLTILRGRRRLEARLVLERASEEQ